jgi:hypothetical protein
MVHRLVEERGLLKASQFGFHVHNNTEFQYVRLKDHVALNFSDEITMAVVFLDVEKNRCYCIAPWPSI